MDERDEFMKKEWIRYNGLFIPGRKRLEYEIEQRRAILIEAERLTGIRYIYVPKSSLTQKRGPERQPVHGLYQSCYRFIHRAALNARAPMGEDDNPIPLRLGIKEMWEEIEHTDDPRISDLVCFKSRFNSFPGHVGFYAGIKNERATVIHLGRRRGTVAEEKIEDVGKVIGYLSMSKFLE